jgi:hypothetical protein
MVDPKRLVLAVALAAAIALPAAADFDAGVAAYERGDMETAAREWTPLAQTGDAEAQFRLWQALRGRNYLQAIGWLLNSAKQGNAGAQNDLAGVYLEGRGLPPDPRKAFDLYRRAAEQGVAEAQRNLGHLYRRGTVVAADADEAVKWYRLAGEQGDLEAQQVLAEMLASGREITRDEAEAAKWQALAAEQGGGEPEQRPGDEDAAETVQLSDEADGAQAIRRRLEQYFKVYGAYLGLDEVRVAERGEGYDVDLVGVRYPLDEGLYVDVGRLSFALDPMEPKLYRLTNVRIPDKMVVRNQLGADVGYAALNLRRLTGVFSTAIQNFIQLDALVEDLRLALSQEGTAVQLLTLAATVESERDGNGLWQMIESLRGSGLRIGEATLGEFAIEEFDFDGKVDAVDFAVWESALTEFEAAAAGGSPNDLLNAMLSVFIRGEFAFYKGLDVGAAFRGISLAGFPAFTLDQFGFRLSAEEAGKGLSKGRFALAHSGLALADGADAELNPFPDLTPEASSLDIAVERFPSRLTMKAFGDLLSAAVEAESRHQQDSNMLMAMMGQKLLTDLRLVMAKVGTTIRFQNTSMVTRAARADLSGELRADASSLLGAVGGLDLRVSGLARIVEALAAEEGGDQGQPGLIEVLRSIAKREQDAGGAPVDSFRFDLTPQGSVTVNGVPMEQILAQGMAGTPQ